jgi:hypothetical protein
VRGLRQWAPEKLERLRAVATTAPTRTRGCALLGGDALVLAFAKPARWSPRRAALILRHEAAHLHGVDHESMSRDVHWSYGPSPGWVKRGVRMRKKRRGRGGNPCREPTPRKRGRGGAPSRGPTPKRRGKSRR